MIWAKCSEFPMYDVSQRGQVRSRVFRRRRVMRPAVGADGYAHLVLRNEKGHRTVSVHRLVAAEFCKGYSVGCVVNHKDGDKLNNSVRNLEWTTSSQNQRHAYRTGLRKPATSNRSRRKVTDVQVINIRHARRDASVKDLALLYGISPCAIRHILTGYTFKHLLEAGDAS